MVNVRFYRLDELPSFIVAKHQGIFVHVTKTMYKDGGSIEHPNPKDPTNLLMKPRKDGESVERINFVQWLENRRIDSIASGLWFGGENGWELLSNDTTSGAIDAAIVDKINALNAGGFTQATIGANPEGSESATGSILKIKGIKETKGKIEQDSTKDVSIAIDGVYNETSNKIATQSTVTTAVTTAINGLDAETVQVVTKTTSGNNTTLTFKGVQEVDGIISQGTGNEELTVGNANLKIQIGSGTATNVFSANAKEDSTIQLDGLVFKKNGDVISVITPTALASDNRLVTEKDIASINGAMHYRGAITSADSLNPDNWPETVAAGDVYIATGKFEKNGNIIESGDLIVFNSATLTDYKVVQSNITLGIGDGQIAKNVGALADGNLVVATDNGIKTTSITETQLTGADNNKRELSYRNGTADTDTINNITLYHDVTIKDAFTVIGKDFTKDIEISSNNRSIEIAANGNTGVVVDLVWNTTMEP